MVLTVTKNGRWRLVGTPDEFADFMSHPDRADLVGVMSAIAGIIEGTTIRFKDHRGWWELRGSRSDLAVILDVPEVKTVAETLEVFRMELPNVRVLSS